MSLYVSRHLRAFSVLAAALWLVILGVSLFRLSTAAFALEFDDVSYYSAAAVLGVAILATTAVLMGVQARSSRPDEDPVRGAGLLGVVAAGLAVAFPWFVPGWIALFLWAIASTLHRSRHTALTTPRMRVLVLAGLAVCALSIFVAALVTMSGAAVGAVLWACLVVLAGVLSAWQIALAVRSGATAARRPEAPPVF